MKNKLTKREIKLAKWFAEWFEDRTGSQCDPSLLDMRIVEGFIDGDLIVMKRDGERINFKGFGK